jgi:hypothetical protein
MIRGLIMSRLKDQLIKLGSNNSDLQKHIRPVLDKISHRRMGEPTRRTEPDVPPVSDPFIDILDKARIPYTDTEIVDEHSGRDPYIKTRIYTGMKWNDQNVKEIFRKLAPYHVGRVDLEEEAAQLENVESVGRGKFVVSVFDLGDISRLGTRNSVEVGLKEISGEIAFQYTV